ncbi:hypothetical protein BC835DRAFT_785906 [Cytidiella melzeri]|nr:hypothetical protein BC835DRAFT_785906 [Cytidiella melzeri]
MARRSVAGTSHAIVWITGLLWASCLVQQSHGSRKYTPYLPQSFFFDWTPAGQSPPIPTTAQCDTIHIEWSRQNAIGPNPTAPYFLQIYTSTFIVPLVLQAGDDSALSFDFPVPFVPGTQYEICMFDINGNTGGCQGIYTVYPQPNITTAPTCTNLTYPAQNQVLGVNAQVDNGPMSQFGWIDQCTDIQLTPTNGTPPYTMTIAPALHPPFNITSKTMDAINWTVSLSYGSPFFVSLVDSTGLSWQNGPLHSGGGGSPACLSQTDADSSSSEVHSWVAAVSGVAGLIVGLLVGMLGALLFLRWQRRHRRGPDNHGNLHRKSSSISITTPVLTHSHQRYTDDLPDHLQPNRVGEAPYQIEPFRMPEREFGVQSSSRNENDRTFGSGTLIGTGSHSASLSQDDPRMGGPSISPTSPSHASVSPSPSGPLLPPRPLSEARQPSQVFVVHHDGGRAPVTVYAADGTEVVELPPQYVDNGSNSSSNSTGARMSRTAVTGAVPPLQFQDSGRRKPGPTPQKTPRRVVN